MWDRQYWYVARQSFRDQRRASRQASRAARRSYRYPYYRKRRVPFFTILFIFLVISAVSHEGLFLLIPLAIIGCFVFMWVRNSMLRSSGFFGSDSNYQQPNQYYQPPQQPYQPNQYYQPPAAPQPTPPPYQAYGQGYQASPQNDYQQGAQPYQSNPSQSAPEQYEEPQAQYPQEMPPMV